MANAYDAGEFLMFHYIVCSFSDFAASPGATALKIMQMTKHTELTILSVF